jgi:hypothetical protein
VRHMERSSSRSAALRLNGEFVQTGKGGGSGNGEADLRVEHVPRRLHRDERGAFDWNPPVDDVLAFISEYAVPLAPPPSNRYRCRGAAIVTGKRQQARGRREFSNERRNGWRPWPRNRCGRPGQRLLGQGPG